jgi:hypothetical protein
MKFSIVIAVCLSCLPFAFASPFSATLSEGDVEIKAASTQESIDLGRDFDLTLTITHSADVKVSLPDLTAMRGRFQGFSVADGFVRDEARDSEGRVVREWRWRLVPEPAAEKYRLAPFAVEVRPVVDAVTDMRSFPTAPVVFPVAPLEQNVGGDVEVTPEPYWIRPTARMVVRWILLAIGAAVLVALVILLVMKLRHAAKLRRMTPSERAFAELSDLLGRGLPEKGLFKDFYIELTHVVRRYIERSHGIRAPEQTTEEFLAAAKAHPRFTPEVIAKLADFLRSADLVKFAGVGSSSSVAEEAVRTARAYIERDAESLSAASGGKADNR